MKIIEVFKYYEITMKQTLLQQEEYQSIVRHLVCGLVQKSRRKAEIVFVYYMY